MCKSFSMISILLLFLLTAVSRWSLARALTQDTHLSQYLNGTALPFDPRPAPAYMVDNQHDYYHTAPDKGHSNGPVWAYSGSLASYMKNLQNGTVIRGGYAGSNSTKRTAFHPAKAKRQSTDIYWLAGLAPLGAQPLAGGDDYLFFRNVYTEYGADPTGETDASEAINAAISSWNIASAGGSNTRCGEECGNTFTQGAIVYFPPGTYKICSPVIQYYYTQFIGDPNDPPTIQGCETFKGIALFDTDPYIPGGSGSQWYVNQNQFFRQIRNFIFDMEDMPESTSLIDGNGDGLVPTGIHWQVAQATSLQNLVFLMPSTETTTAVGIFTENGSGGFVSNITFGGGNIGWRAGSQQYTARNLHFELCNTAIQMVWDWGWTWQQITISQGNIGFNISGVGGDTGQGTGSVSIVDTVFTQTVIGILTNGLATSPNIVLDNTVFNSVPSPIVSAVGGASLLSGSPELWATGARYSGSTGSLQTGPVVGAPSRAPGLVDSATGFLFVRDRPQYENLLITNGDSGFLIATAQDATANGACVNDGTGDQTTCLNAFLQKAVAANQIAYFPAGIYRVGGTVFIPTGSKVQGSSWSQIQGAGFFFSDMANPKVMIQVGNKGDIGSLEIVEMLFSVQGNTAGAILMEWNVAADSQGSAGMWDSHFRVGGGIGTDLDMATCPKFSNNPQCIAASLLLHLTSQSNGYFENVWAWVADHDNDFSLYDQFDSTISQISVFSARGMLIESQGPSWFVGTSSEHSVLYNYQLSNAQDIYMGHIQTESPYFQPLPGAPAPFGAAAARFNNDPDFSSCNVTASSVDEKCLYAWGLRIVDSSNVIIHGAGLYSFFNDYYQDCDDTHDCQERILEVICSTGVVIYNLFTVATVQIANGIDDSLLLQAANQRGFSTEVSVWLPLPGADNVEIVYVGSEVFGNPTVSCTGTCLLVFPTSPLATPTTITPSLWVTSFEYGGLGPTVVGGQTVTVFITSTTTVTLIIPNLVVTGMPYSNVNITSSGPTSITMYPSVDIGPTSIPLPNGAGSTTTRVIPLPPWPLINQGPAGTEVVTDPGSDLVGATSPGVLGSSTTYYTPLSSIVTAPGATVTTITFPASVGATTISCPAATQVAFATPAITVSTTCTQSAQLTFNFACPTTKVVTFLASTAGVFVSVDCSLITFWSTGQDSTSTTDSLPVFATWPLYGSIVPLATTIDQPQPTDDGVIVPCNAWFFFICISWGELNVGSWHWILPPGIYGPGPPPISIIQWPTGVDINGNLPNWPKITIGTDNQITTDEEDECETQTAEACTTTTFLSTAGLVTSTLSSASMCETISGCSISVSDSSTEDIVGTQTAAPIGTFYDEDWASMTLQGDAWTLSVYAALTAALAAQEASAYASTISITSGPTVGPTCDGGAGACGGTLCTGYWCTPVPTGLPPGYLDPKDPNSGGYVAPTTHISGGTSTAPTPTPTTATVCPASPTCNCNEDFCDACSPACCANGSCSSSSTITSAEPTPTCDCTVCGSPFSPDCCTSDCEGLLQPVPMAGPETNAGAVKREGGTVPVDLWGFYPRETVRP